MKSSKITWVAALGVALLLSGCGKNDESAKSTPDASASTSATPGSAATSTDATAGGSTAATGRAIEITGNDAMKFSLTEIRAKPGETLTVTLVNVGTMPKLSMGHNWVLLKAKAPVDQFVTAAMQAVTTDHIPMDRKDDVIAHTKLLGPKQKDTVTFNAPKEPGNYPFLCSFPGHFQVGMKGVLIVE
jgi:azurin